MLSRKLMTIGMSILLMATVFTVPAFAHGYRSRGHHSEVEIGCAAEENAGSKCAADGNCLLCTVDGCEQTGHHLHEDTVYCGYPHECGYCDGTCAWAEEPQAKEEPSSGTLRGNVRIPRGYHSCH